MLFRSDANLVNGRCTIKRIAATEAIYFGVFDFRVNSSFHKLKSYQKNPSESILGRHRLAQLGRKYQLLNVAAAVIDLGFLGFVIVADQIVAQDFH